MKVTGDGNSLMASDMLPQAMALAPLAGSGATFVNLGIGAQSTRMMNGLDGGSAADVDAAWDATKQNVLVVWEATNDVHYYGKTVDQGEQNMRDYLAARKALHPWRIVLLTTLPRFQADQAGVYGQDAKLVQWNARARLRYREWGAHVLVDVRQPGSPFNFDGTIAANFTNTQQYWQEGAEWVHLNSAGNAVVASMLAAGLRRLSKRLP